MSVMRKLWIDCDKVATNIKIKLCVRLDQAPSVKIRDCLQVIKPV